MRQLIDFFQQLGSSDAFMPRWVCGEWSELHGWVYIISDLVIFLAYMAIPVTMLIFVRKRWDDVPFKPVFWLYILFIMLCGFTHLIDAVIFYEPIYRVNALVLALTAVVSMITVGAMVYVLPKALAYKSPVELERVVDQKTAEFKAQVLELNKLSERISRKKEQLEQFAYITSHNLRTPAANLHSLLELLDSIENDEEKIAVQEKIKSSVDTMLLTLDDVSNVVRQSSPQLDAAEMSFKKVIDEILAQEEYVLNEVEAKIDIDLQVQTIFYPPDHFRSILQNLIENAIKYRNPVGPFRLELKTYMNGDRVVFECTDNGIGIDLDKNRDKIFKLYKTIGKENNGKGVGLFLVRNQLENLNGFINLTSETGKGSKFIVTFGVLENKA
ncbi:MAG: HAMP domain-containing histidine kinase [Flavobacteriales bacterium]|nr:HAMP domain-containing histidine kinase [Flavobacteriales bacterium]